MSKVRFIQLTVNDGENYQTKIDQALIDYPGAIIFVTDNGKGKQEIWANGLKYEVGGGGGNVIYGDVAVNADGYVVLKEDAQGNPTEFQSGEEGSIYVYKGLTSQTAYFWSTVEKKWKPFNVDAENIYFPNGFERTEAWGYFTASADGTLKNETKPTKGETPKNLIQVFEHYLVKPIFPTEVKVTANEPDATFTAAYTTKQPVSISAKQGDNNLQNNKHVLVNSTINLSSTFNSSIKIDEHIEELVYGPISITGMTYGGRHKSSTSGAFTVFPGSSPLSGDSVTLNSVANSSVTRGDRTLDVKKDGATTSLDTVTYDSTNTSDTLSLTNISYTVKCGQQSIVARGSTESVFERILTTTESEEYDEKYVTVPKLPYTDIEYYNNKKSETLDVPDDNLFDPKADHIIPIADINMSAGVDSTSVTFTVTGYYPIWFGLLSGSKITNVGAISDLKDFKKTGADGFTGSSKTVYITPSSSQSSGSYTPFIIVPADRTVQFGRFDKSITQVYAQGTEVQVKGLSNWTTDGAGNNINYNAYILNGSTISWSGNGKAKFTLTIS